ncbi:sulfite exporter TauE/SafE family protein [Allorhizocola rhizosphaerae]|uniref:sulfite exporter TauE/SafE family protein n=1 Tax=Allorhizocola rhizosphaerae TaxID=1872709 RepID=UPI000E3CBCB1|nr:sulfite exporter TauE/SafE family protein [Allorhizocola rhizosphaerae]
MDLAQALLLAAAGVATGAVNAVAGGGSLMTFPALLWVGLPPISASVTNSVSVAFGYVGGVLSTKADLKSQTALRWLLPSVILGCVVGCGLLLSTTEGVFAWVAPALVLAASLLMALQDRVTRLLAQPHDQPAWAKIAAVFAIGVYGGYFISAIGVVIMAVLGLVLSDPIRRMVATKNALQLGIGATAAVAYALFGPVVWEAVLALVPGTLLGGFIGGHYGRRLSARALRWIVVGFGLVVSALLFARAL